jgi:hypothetical protein
MVTGAMNGTTPAEKLWGQSEQERWLGEEIEWLLGQFITKLTISVILASLFYVFSEVSTVAILVVLA